MASFIKEELKTVFENSQPIPESPNFTLLAAWSGVDDYVAVEILALGQQSSREDLRLFNFTAFHGVRPGMNQCFSKPYYFLLNNNNNNSNRFAKKLLVQFSTFQPLFNYFLLIVERLQREFPPIRNEFVGSARSGDMIYKIYPKCSGIAHLNDPPQQNFRFPCKLEKTVVLPRIGGEAVCRPPMIFIQTTTIPNLVRWLRSS